MDKKTAAIRYYSQTGNTKKLAEAIGSAIGVKAESISVPVKEHVDVLFLGASVYWAGINAGIKQFIWSLDPALIGRAVVFSTSALTEFAFPSVKKCFEERGIKVEERNFYCRGQFYAIHSGKPDHDDLKAVGNFAKQVME